MEFFVDRSSKEVKSRDFTGQEHWKIFTAINLRDLIPEHTHVEQICKLWKTFIDMMTFLKKQSFSCEQIYANLLKILKFGLNFSCQ